jgi:hypothetical protein
MAEVDLASSHSPWAPLPELVRWTALGDGSVYWPIAYAGDTPSEVWGDRDRLRAAYVSSLVYSWRSLLEFVRRYGDDDLVLVVLGDHQPVTMVSGTDAGRDVPVSVIANDPAVLRRISSWGWQAGLLPGPNSSVARMDAFRARFLDAYDTPLRPPRGAGSGRDRQ